MLFHQIFNWTAPSSHHDSAERKWIQKFRNKHRLLSYPKFFPRVQIPQPVRVYPIASSVFGGPELFSCVLQPHSSLHRLCPQQHLKALLCWLLYKCAARHGNYLLQWSLGLSCLKWKVQTVGLRTALQHWKVRGFANRISRCCNLLPFWSGYTRKLARK